MNAFLGLPNSRYSGADLKGRRSANTHFDGVAGAALNGAQVGAQTLIPTLDNNTVALIDHIHITVVKAAAAALNVLTMTLNGNTVEIASAGNALAVGQDLSIHPEGSLVVDHGSSLTMQATAVSEFFVTVEYRLMGLTAAIQSGYYRGVPFCKSLSATGDFITSATVTPARGLEIRGVAITGIQTTAAGGASKEVMIGFWDGATERKLVKNCYGSNNILHAKPLIIGNAVLRGPKGFGVRATFDQAANARAAVWGFFYTDNQRTYPGTGVPAASAIGPFDAGDYFWMFTEITAAAATAALFPVTTTATLKTYARLDGYAASIASNAGDGGGLIMGWLDSGQVIHTLCACNGLMGDTNVRKLAFRFQADSQLGLAVNGFGVGDADKIGALIWGRFGGGPPHNLTGYRTEEYSLAT